MASTVHQATPEDDGRHAPGPGSLTLWNESYWFPFYDPKSEIAVVFRIGIHANLGTANLFFYVAHRGAVVHAVIDHHLPVPAVEPGRLAAGGVVIEWEKPRERFRLRSQHGSHAMDVVWQAISPTYAYPRPPDTSYDVYPGHIEQGATVTGTVTIAGTPHRIDCLGHRDHSWGGERDWSNFHRWNYLNGEFGPDFWFNAVRIDIGPEVDVRLGCLWNGRELLDLRTIDLEVATGDGGARQLGAEVRLTDEHGGTHHIVGDQIVVIFPVQYGRTWLKDAVTRYRYAGRTGWGILEHGYVERE